MPNRLVWDNWQRFMGERDNPSSSVDFLVPHVQSPLGGFAVGSIYDYFGLPTVGQIDPAGSIGCTSLPLRAYTLIWNEWFRDQNLQDSIQVAKNDGPDDDTDFALLRRGKRHDYFTSCLPWPQKGESVSIPIGTTAPIIATGDGVPVFRANGLDRQLIARSAAGQAVGYNNTAVPTDTTMSWGQTKLVADLSDATAATVNQLRQSFQIQKLLERDARWHALYGNFACSLWCCVSGRAVAASGIFGGGTTQVNISPIAQTMATPATETGGWDTPQGHLAAVGTALARGHGFHQSFTEHGYIIGLASVRADLTYQQGLRRHWSRRTL